MKTLLRLRNKSSQKHDGRRSLRIPLRRGVEPMREWVYILAELLNIVENSIGSIMNFIYAIKAYLLIRKEK